MTTFVQNRDRISVAVAVAALLVSVLPSAAFADHAIVAEGDGLVTSVRWAGETRYDTAAKLGVESSASRVAEPVTSVILATGEKFPDALAGAYLSAATGAPVLLTERDAVPTETLALLTGDAPSDLTDVETIYLLGGPVAISAAVQSTLEAEGFTVVRLEGADRVQTAAVIAAEAPGATVGEVDGMRTAILATSQKFPDALVAGAASRAASLPLLLTDLAKLPDVTATALETLDIEQVLIAGGEAAVSLSVEAELQRLGYDTRRIAGENRNATAIEFATFNVAELGFSTRSVGLARNDNFPDALAFAPFAGREQISITLTSPTALTTETGSYLASLADCRFRTLFIPGGPVAISPDVEQAARAALTTSADCTGVDNTDPTIVSTTIVRAGTSVSARSLPGDNDGVVNVDWSEPVTCTDDAPEQFRHIAGNGSVTLATSLQCDRTDTTIVGFPGGVLDRDDTAAAIGYVPASNPAFRVTDLEGNTAGVVAAVALFPAEAPNFGVCSDGLDLTQAVSSDLTTLGEVQSVATDGDVVVTGSPVRSGGSGNVYVQVSNGDGTFSTPVTLAGSPTTSGLAFFGRSVGISGGTIVVGADGQNGGTGGAYVYESDGAGGYTGPVTLSNPTTGVSGFGRDVAIDGDRIVVGAFGAGAAYVYTRTAAGWSAGVSLANPTTAGSNFGFSVDIDRGQVVVGAAGANGNFIGGAYVYTPTGASTFSAPVTLTGSGERSKSFGWEVAIDEGRVVVGTNATVNGVGQAFVFEPAGAGFADGILLENPTDVGSLFGFSVAVAGDQVVVGAFANGAGDEGGVFAYQPDGDGGWSDPRPVVSAFPTQRGFGESVAVSRDKIVARYRNGAAKVTVVEGPRCPRDETAFGVCSGGLDLSRAVSNDLTTLGEVQSVATDGDVVVMGAPVRSGGSGNVYVQTSNGDGTFSTPVTLAGSPTTSGLAFFGRSVGISGGTIVVGADGQNSNNGGAYVYESDGEGGYTGPVVLANPTTGVSRFGRDVAIDGDTIVVGAFGTGAAYVYSRTADGWSSGSAVTNPTGAGSNFGFSVDVDGGQVVVGAPGANGGFIGGAYVYATPGSAPVVLAGSGERSKSFGWEVAIDEGRVVVGTNATVNGVGQAFVFEPAGAGFADGVLLDNPTDVGSLFGFSVAVAGDQVVVGAFANGAGDEGGVFAYQPDGDGGWSSPRPIVSAFPTQKGFGESVAVSRDKIVARYRNGAAKVTVVEGPRCPQLEPEFGVCNDGLDLGEATSNDLTTLGEVQSVATDGDVVVTGAPVRSGGSGNVYVQVSNGDGTFTSTVTLAGSPTTSGNAFFGRSVGISGDTIVVGADGQNSGTGGAYVYESDGAGGYTGPVTLTNPTTGVSGFGRDVAIDGDTIVVGAFGTGAAYVYERTVEGWSAGTAVTNPTGSGSNFGFSVDVDGGQVVVGAPGANGNFIGGAYVYATAGSAPVTLAGTGERNRSFGWEVAIDDGRAVVGTNTTVNGVGQAFVFEPAAVGFADGILLDNPTDVGSLFGFSVAIAGDQVVVGAFANGAGDEGGVFAYQPDGDGGWSSPRPIVSAFPTQRGFGESVAVSRDKIVARYRNGAAKVTVVEGPRCDGGSVDGGDQEEEVGVGGTADPDAYRVNVRTDGVDADLTDGVCETATDGECSLRAAVMQANYDAGPGTITVDRFDAPMLLTLSGAGDFLTASGDLDIKDDVAIDGITTGGYSRLDGAGLGDRAFDVAAGVTLTVEDLYTEDFTLPAEAVGDDGRGAVVRLTGATLVTDGAYFVSGTAPGAGGGLSLDAVSTAQLVDTWFDSNTAGTFGGAIHNDGGVVTYTEDDGNFGSNVQGNSAADGGAFWTTGANTFTVQDVRLVNNTASGQGGAFFNSGSTFAFVDVDAASGNEETVAPIEGRIYAYGGDATATAEGATNFPEQLFGSGPLCETGSNIAATTTASGTPTDGDGSCFVVEGGGGDEEVGVGGTADPDSYRVNVRTDGVDADLTDGICETATDGECSLRAAVMQANYDAGPGTITVDRFDAPMLLTLSGAGDFLTATGDLDIKDDVAIDGITTGGYSRLDGAGLGDRAFDVAAGVTLTVKDLYTENFTLPAEAVGDDGRGAVVRLTGATLVTDGAYFVSGTAPGAGGGLSLDAASTAQLVDTWFDSNTAGTFGGAIHNDGGSVTYTEDDGNFGSNVQGNSAADGGAFWTTGGSTFTVQDVRVVNSNASGEGGAFFNNAGVFDFIDVDAASGNEETAAPIQGRIYAYEGAASATASGNTRFPEQLFGSGPLCETGSNIAATTTASGTPTDGDGSCFVVGGGGGGGGGDEEVGVGGTADPDAYRVNVRTDGVDADLTDGVCETATDGECSLRAAVMQANYDAGPGTITVDRFDAPMLLTLSGAGDFLTASGDLDIKDDVAIDGITTGGYSRLDGAGLGDRAFDVAAGVTLTVKDLYTEDFTLPAEAVGDDGRGAGVRLTGSHLVTDGAYFTSGTAPGAGGGLSLDATSTAQLVDTWFASNAAGTFGGAIHNDGGAVTYVGDDGNFGSVMQSNAAVDGGGVWTTGPNTITIDDVYVVNNSASGEGGAFFNNAGVFDFIDVDLFYGNKESAAPYNGDVYAYDGAASATASGATIIPDQGGSGPMCEAGSNIVATTTPTGTPDSADNTCFDIEQP